MIIYFCELDGYCRREFKTKAYPELRYYKTAETKTEKYVMHRNPKKYDLDDLYLFFKNRISGISYQVEFTNLDEQFKMIKKKAFGADQKIVLFCRNDFTFRGYQYIKALGRNYIDVLNVQIDNCEAEHKL